MMIRVAIRRPVTVQRDALFYCVELFDDCGLTAIQFFDGDQLEVARRSAIDAIQCRQAERARILDDQARLVFRPALLAPCRAGGRGNDG
jgi:hypothetical protein